MGEKVEDNNLTCCGERVCEVYYGDVKNTKYRCMVCGKIGDKEEFMNVYDEELYGEDNGLEDKFVELFGILKRKNPEFIELVFRDWKRERGGSGLVGSFGSMVEFGEKK